MIDLQKNINNVLKKAKSQSNAVIFALKWYEKEVKDKRSKSLFKLNLTDQFKAGRIYRFNYVAQTPELPYYDTNPIIISLGRIKFKNSICERGINLNCLPMDVRHYVLTRIFKSYGNIIGKQIGEPVKDQDGLPLNFRVVKNLLNSVYAEYAIRNYFISYKTDVHCISYENWDKAAFIETDKFIGANKGQVRIDYYNYIKLKMINKINKD